MKGVGIEKINLYGSSLYLDQRKLAEARGHDPDRVVSDFMIDTGLSIPHGKIRSRWGRMPRCH